MNHHSPSTKEGTATKFSLSQELFKLELYLMQRRSYTKMLEATEIQISQTINHLRRHLPWIEDQGETHETR